jgi:hypothetical protein
MGRPKPPQANQMIAIRIDPRLLVRRQKPYETEIHELLEQAAT